MDEYLSLISVPAIAAVVYWVVNLIKYTTKNNETVLHFVPLISAVLGVVCGIIAFYAIPDIIPADNVFVAILIGGASGLTATGCNQIIKQISKASEEAKTTTTETTETTDAAATSESEDEKKDN